MIEYVNDSFQKTDEQVSSEVLSVMCRTIVRGDLLLSDTSFVATSKKDKIGSYNCKLYDIVNLKYVTLHRSDTTKNDKTQPRKPRDEGAALSFEEYFYEVVDFPPGKGTGMIYESERLRKKSRKFKGTVALSDEFPISIKDLMPLIEVLSPTGKHFDKLNTFFVSKFPEGNFPVQIGSSIFSLAYRLLYTRQPTTFSIDRASCLSNHSCHSHLPKVCEEQCNRRRVVRNTAQLQSGQYAPSRFHYGGRFL